MKQKHRSNARRLPIWVLLILNRRPAEEHKDLIALVEQHAHDMEVENMAQSIIELTREQGEKQGREQAHKTLGSNHQTATIPIFCCS